MQHTHTNTHWLAATSWWLAQESTTSSCSCPHSTDRQCKVSAFLSSLGNAVQMVKFPLNCFKESLFTISDLPSVSVSDPERSAFEWCILLNCFFFSCKILHLHWLEIWQQTVSLYERCLNAWSSAWFGPHTEAHSYKSRVGGEQVFQVLLVMAFNWQEYNGWPCCSMYQYSKSKEEFSFSYRPDIAYFICVYCSVLYLCFHFVSFWILSDWAAFFYDTSWLFSTLENLL